MLRRSSLETAACESARTVGIEGRCCKSFRNNVYLQMGHPDGVADAGHTTNV